MDRPRRPRSPRIDESGIVEPVSDSVTIPSDESTTTAGDDANKADADEPPYSPRYEVKYFFSKGVPPVNFADHFGIQVSQ